MHCLKRLHWDPFERFVLRVIAENAKDIREIHLRIISAPHQDEIGRDAIKATLEDMLDRFLLQLKPDHVALGNLPIGIFAAPTTSHMLQNLVERALEMLIELRDSLSHPYALRCLTDEGLTAIGLNNEDWKNHLASRTANVVWEIPPDLLKEMDARILADDPLRTELRADSLAKRIQRRIHYVKRTLHEIERSVGDPNWDILVAKRLNMTSHRIVVDEQKGQVSINATINLQDIAQWEITIPVHDHGTLDAGTSLELSGIEHTAGILLGRRIDRDRRGLDEDDTALIAVPLVSALKWREKPLPGEYPSGKRLHLNQDIVLSKGVVVNKTSGQTSWIDIPQQLPDTLVDGLNGRPITDLVTHTWLDPRMIVCGGYTGNGSTRLLVHMPIVRLSKINDADDDPHEEWRELQRHARRQQEKAEEHIRCLSQTTRTQVPRRRKRMPAQEAMMPMTSQERRHIITWRIAAAILLSLIFLGMAILLWW